jgi:hypothetical protein
MGFPTSPPYYRALLRGDIFQYSIRQQTVPAASEFIIAIETNGRPLIIESRQVVTAISDLDVEVYEDQSFTAGTPLIGENRYRKSTKANSVVVTAGVTATPTGDPFIWNDLVPPSGNQELKILGSDWVVAMIHGYLLKQPLT